tara:strand:+ start:142 stop:573 length:432 start_codon:yes stop_codon:yes gene_type:complete
MSNDTLRELDSSLIISLRDSRFLEIIRGFVAGTLHYLIIAMLSWIAIFSFDMKTLWVALFMLIIIGLANIMLHNCPLTEIEQCAFGDCLTDFFNRYFPINYDCNRRYEVQLQYIILAGAMVLTKILFFYVKDDVNKYILIKYT